MLSEKQIVERVLSFVGGSRADRINWRVGITSDCQRVFDSYAQPQAARNCFEATDNQTARRAVEALREQGFSGISNFLSLPSLRWVFVYQLAVDRHSPIVQPAKVPATRRTPGSASRPAVAIQSKALVGGVLAFTFLAFFVWFIFSMVFVFINREETDRYEWETSDLPEVAPLDSGLLANNFDDCYESRFSSEFLYVAEEVEELPVISHRCSYRNEEGVERWIYLRKSHNLDDLIKASVSYCSPSDGDEAVHYVLHSEDFLIEPTAYFYSRTENNEYLQRLHAELSPRPELGLSLVDYCRPETPEPVED